MRTDVRILAATNKNLEKEVRQGRFREDLYYRLRIVSIHLPPLRSRLDDVPQLVDYFVGRFAAEYGSPVWYVASATLHKLQAYHWPGNVRELENCLRRAVLMCHGEVLLPEHVQFENQTEPESTGSWAAHGPLQDQVCDLVAGLLESVGKRPHASIIDLVEHALVAQALQRCGFNQVRAARLLRISRNTLRHRMRKYRIEPPSPPLAAPGADG